MQKNAAFNALMLIHAILWQWYRSGKFDLILALRKHLEESK